MILHFVLQQCNQLGLSSRNFTMQVPQVTLPSEVLIAMETCFNWTLIGFYFILDFLYLLFGITSNLDIHR